MSVEKNKKDIVKKMKAVNTYNSSFSHSINVLARTLSEYDRVSELFEQMGGNVLHKHTNKNGSTNIVKNPLYLAIEKMREDILAYSRELGLTPAGLKRLKDEVGESSGSKLAKVLSELK